VYLQTAPHIHTDPQKGSMLMSNFFHRFSLLIMTILATACGDQFWQPDPGHERRHDWRGTRRFG
jgi:hypothetical protein